MRKLNLLLLLLLFVQLYAQQQPAIPISTYGIWDRGDRFLNTPTDSRYNFFKGTRLEYRWSDVQPTSAANYDFSTLRAQLELCDQYNKYAYINLFVGPESPAWIYTNGVPKVLTDATTQFNGEFPYYLDPEYKTYYYNLIAAYGQALRALPENLRKRIAFVQVMTGCTGDEVAYKGNVKSSYSQYNITDDQWVEFRKTAFSKYKQAFMDGNSATKIPLLFNNIDPDNNAFEAVAWQWVRDSVGTGFGYKGSAYVRGHHLSDEFRFKNTWDQYCIDPQGMVLFSRSEMDQTCTKTMYNLNPKIGFYWGVLNGLNTGLSVHDLSVNASDMALADTDIMSSIQFFNKYAGQIFPKTATAAYSVFHEGLNSENTVKFPEATYGTATPNNTARYTAICNAYTSKGAKMDDLTAATNGQVYQRSSQTGYNDSGWSIEEGNYERFITQIDPDNTSIGLFRVRGTITTSSSKYDRFARSFQNSTSKNAMYFKFHSDLFALASPDTLTFSVTWLDKTAGSTWDFRYDNGTGLLVTAKSVTGSGSNTWKTEKIVVTNGVMQKNGPLGSDFALINTDTKDDIFNGVEVDIVRRSVAKQNQTITFAALPSKTVGDADFSAGATASSGLTVSYTSSNTAVATIVGGNLHIVGAGTSVITASQSGDATYNAATSVNQTLIVAAAKLNQSITFAALPSKTVGDADFSAGATASSGLTVSYTSSNTAVATIVGGNLHIVGAGTSVITASQSGDATYNAATSVNQTLTVTTPATLTVNPVADSYVDASTATRNYGKDLLMIMKSGSTSTSKKVMVRFDLTGHATAVTSAKFRIYCNFLEAALPLTVFQMTDSWTETGITSKNCPATGSAIATQTLSVASQYYEFDVTSYVQSQIASGDFNISMLISNLTTDGLSAKFNTREALTNTPELVISGSNLKSAFSSNPSEERVDEAISISIYPNPVKVNSVINVDLRKTVERTQIQLFDLNGKLCFANTYTNCSSFSFLPILKSGTYVIRIETGSENRVQKLIVY